MADTSLRPFITGNRPTFFKECFVHVILWLPTEGNTVKDNKIATVNLLFCGLLNKSFLGHYEDDMLWITLKGILKLIVFFHAHGSDILDMKSLVKFSANKLDPFVSLKNENFPFSALISNKGLRGTLHRERSKMKWFTQITMMSLEGTKGIFQKNPNEVC